MLGTEARRKVIRRKDDGGTRLGPQNANAVAMAATRMLRANCGSTRMTCTPGAHQELTVVAGASFTPDGVVDEARATTIVASMRNRIAENSV